MKKFAVIGNPISHSLSPVIHQQFAKQFDINLEYTKIQAESSQFGQKISEFRANGGFGLNVTVPYKKDAFVLAEQLSDSSILAKSVNTLSFNEGKINGDNTDGLGLINDLKVNKGITLSTKRILILGAGGAVSGVIGPLLAQHPELLLIANRTAEKARDLAAQFSTAGPVIGCGLKNIEKTKFDLVINGTAASMTGELPQVNSKVLEDVAFAYDMMYSDSSTTFINWAQQHGVINTADGLGMLVEQAAASFFIWHAKRPDTGSVLKHLRSIMSV